MNRHLTICYISTRKENQFHWFVESLIPQVKDEDDISVVMVDANCEEKTTYKGICNGKFTIETIPSVRTPPMPNVWNGKHRLTKENWFNASAYRNTGLCMAPDGWLAYCDDLSVLGPHWLQSVRESIAGNYCVLGTYEKHNKMIVEDGKLIYSQPYSTDARWNHAKGDVTSCGGDWLYGCSLAGPVQAFLDVNGWPSSLTGGLGSEDYCMGIAIGNTSKYSFRFDRRMKTIESEEMHYLGEKFKKSDYGVSPADKSHAALNTAKQSQWFPQHFGGAFDNISDLRQHILNGGEFPIPAHPIHEWFTKQLLSEL